MAPSLRHLISRDIQPSRAAQAFSQQLTQPGDIFTILLILGGDVIARALAQVTGSGPSTVAFSFGWVAYSISALVSAVGDNKLLALDPDCKCKVIHGQSGYVKENSSWIIGRIVRDFSHWRHPSVEAKTMEVLGKRQEQLRAKDPNAKLPPIAGLVISIYRPSLTATTGRVERDLVYWIGIPVIVVQLGIAAIPWGLFGDWGIFLITACGTALSLATGLLPQWAKEKWACRRNAKHSYTLTRGSGTQHAIVVLGNNLGFNLEDLASGQSNTLVVTNTFTRITLLALAALWILLLITAAGQKTNTWFLLAVGGLGILQNIYVAGAQRNPENFGVPLEYVTVFGDTSVMETMFQVEEQYKGIGRSMLGEFFPGDLPKQERIRWDSLERTWAKRTAEEKEAVQRNNRKQASGKGGEQRHLGQALQQDGGDRIFEVSHGALRD